MATSVKLGLENVISLEEDACGSMSRIFRCTDYTIVGYRCPGWGGLFGDALGIILRITGCHGRYQVPREKRLISDVSGIIVIKVYNFKTSRSIPFKPPAASVVYRLYWILTKQIECHMRIFLNNCEENMYFFCFINSKNKLTYICNYLSSILEYFRWNVYEQHRLYNTHLPLSV